MFWTRSWLIPRQNLEHESLSLKNKKPLNSNCPLTSSLNIDLHKNWILKWCKKTSGLKVISNATLQSRQSDRCLSVVLLNGRNKKMCLFSQALKTCYTDHNATSPCWHKNSENKQCCTKILWNKYIQIIKCFFFFIELENCRTQTQTFLSLYVFYNFLLLQTSKNELTSCLKYPLE